MSDLAWLSCRSLPWTINISAKVSGPRLVCSWPSRSLFDVCYMRGILHGLLDVSGIFHGLLEVCGGLQGLLDMRSGLYGLLDVCGIIFHGLLDVCSRFLSLLEVCGK